MSRSEGWISQPRTEESKESYRKAVNSGDDVREKEGMTFED